jgi:hypothetical protein
VCSTEQIGLEIAEMHTLLRCALVAGCFKMVVPTPRHAAAVSTNKPYIRAEADLAFQAISSDKRLFVHNRRTLLGAAALTIAATLHAHAGELA